jgi:hypothetical protein
MRHATKLTMLVSEADLLHRPAPSASASASAAAGFIAAEMSWTFARAPPQANEVDGLLRAPSWPAGHLRFSNNSVTRSPSWADPHAGGDRTRPEVRT